MDQRDHLLQHDFASNLSLLQKYPPVDMIYLLERSSELQEKDSRKTRKEVVLELLDVARSNGREVLEGGFKRITQLKDLIIKKSAGFNLFDDE